MTKTTRPHIIRRRWREGVRAELPGIAKAGRRNDEGAQAGEA